MHSVRRCCSSIPTQLAWSARPGFRGACAIDRLMRQGRRRATAELAAVLALQVLGGDPEDAYLTAVCGAGYAVMSAIRARPRPDWFHVRSITLEALVIWVGAMLGLASTRIARPGFLTMNALVLATWFALALGLAWHWSRHRGEAKLATMLAKLIGACAWRWPCRPCRCCRRWSSAAKAGGRSGLPPSNVYRYSLHPCRVIELIWPNVYGTSFPENRCWLQAVPPVGGHEIGMDAVYMGGGALVLALSAAGFRGGPPWRGWITIVALVGLAASFGKYGRSALVGAMGTIRVHARTA